MKVITLHQPHASLIAHCVKRIETRSWSTKYRGALAIHAGKLKPPAFYYRYGSFQSYASIPWHDSLDRYYEGDEEAISWTGPLGAIVATCELVDVVPIHSLDFDATAPGIDNRIVDMPLFRGLHYLCKCGDDWKDIEVEDQRPYGDYRPGRFAWILDDIKPLSAPIPAKGKQGLWELEMEVA